MDNIKIKFKDEVITVPKGMTLLKISENFKKYYKHDILVGKVNSLPVSLNHVVNEDSIVNFFDVSSIFGNKAYERTAILILTKAVFDVFNKSVRIEQSIDKGIYCVIDNLKKEDLITIKNKMIEIVNASYPIDKLMVDRLKMIKFYESTKQYDKGELLRYISNTYVTVYKLDNIYDYLYGEMAINTSYIKYFNLEYIGNNGLVLMLPFVYDDNKVEEYVHHDKLFDTVLEYIDWANKIGLNNITDVNKVLSNGNWNDLIFMSEAVYNNHLISISNKISENNNIRVVLISGPSCSGKTTTSKKLELFLSGKGLKPYALSIDDYFKERDETPLDEDGNKDYESLDALDINLFNEQLTKLLNKEEVLLPTYNFITGKKEYKKKLKIPDNGILIIEGLHALSDELTKKISNEKKFKVYISPLTCLNLDNHNRLNTTDNRLLRRIVRDNLRRGYSASDTLDSWKRVRLGETKYVFPNQDNADVVLNTSLIYELNVLKVYAEPLLFSVKEDDSNYREAIRLINILRMVLPMPAASIPLDSILREFIGNGCFEE